jgi:ornithine cyclodeaminase/alanine dehydrogenase-like protein (mu-crystallin family)
MTLRLSEADVRAVLTMSIALDAVEDISRRQASGEAIVHSRRRIELPNHGFFHYMAAADMAAGFLGMKLYTFVKGELRFLVPLYRVETGELVALMEADYMGQMRTGAASGVATKYMARKDARTAAIIGTGLQARSQLEAIAAVRKLESARVFGRDAQRREKFSSDMSTKLGLPITPADSAEKAATGADIIVTATTASHPVLRGDFISTGAHINAIGANHAHKSELDQGAVRRAHRIVVDSIEQSKVEAGDLIIAFAGEDARWADVSELSDVVTGKINPRTSESDITLFKSNGLAAWDVAVAERVFTLATHQGLGKELPLWKS